MSMPACRRFALPIACAMGATFIGAPATAGTITFSDRTAFELAAGIGLVTEDFEEANVADGNVAFTLEPLNSSTNDGVFSTGDIADGFALGTTGGTGQLAVLGDFNAIVGNTSKVVGSNVFSDNTELFFTSSSAVGFDIWLNASASVTVAYFGEGNVFLGSTLVPITYGSPSFFGVINDSGLITRVLITSQFGELVDDVSFNNVVPEPATLLLLGTGLGAVAARRRLKKRA